MESISYFVREKAWSLFNQGISKNKIMELMWKQIVKCEFEENEIYNVIDNGFQRL